VSETSAAKLAPVDIFISYAHLDNVPFGEERKAWVSDFHRDLATRLQHLRRAPVTIWRDPKLAGNDVFGAEIEAQVQGAAVLLVVVSPPYTESDWCRKELELFLKTATDQQRLQIGNKMVVVKVVKLMVDRARLPDCLQSTLGYEFYREDGTGHVRELFLHPDPEVRRTYWPKVDDVAQDLVALLDLRAHAGAAAPAPSGPPVFLAQSTSDLDRERDLVRRELTARGYEVLPAGPLPLRSEELVATVNAGLERAVLSVHLLGARYGVVPEGESRSIVALQHDLAVARHKPRIVWIPPGLQPIETSQQSFLDAVRHDPSSRNGFEVIESTLEDLKTLVVSRLSKPKAGPPAARAEGAPPFVYVVCDQADQPAMPAVEQHLRGAGFEVALPVFRGDVSQLREDHEETLKVCDAVLLYWGQGDELWRRAKLRDLVRIRGRGRAEPFLAKAVLLAEPPSDEKKAFQTAEAEVLSDLDAFVALVRGAAGRQP
jgi:TIR domain-containing protein